MRCSGGVRISGLTPKTNSSLSLDKVSAVINAINPLNHEDRQSIGSIVKLLRFHPVWKRGASHIRSMRDPFYRNLVAWWQQSVASIAASGL